MAFVWASPLAGLHLGVVSRRGVPRPGGVAGFDHIHYVVYTSETRFAKALTVDHPTPRNIAFPEQSSVSH